MRIRYYIENLERNECYAIIGYFYNICKNLDSFRGCSKFFCLFNAFVEKFEFENRSLEVTQAIIQKSIQEKQLTLFNPRENYQHPFDYRNELEQNFEEDLMISKKFEKFNTHTILNINLCRCIFAKNENFAKIIALTFFYKETEQIDLDILEKQSKDIKMPSHISQAIKNIKPIAFLIEALKLSDEEAKLLLLAYRTSAIYELREAVTCSLSDDYTDIYAKFLDISGLKIKTLLRSDKKLVSFGLMNDNAEVPDDCNESIFSRTLDPFFFNILKENSTEIFFDISTYSIKKEYSNLALQFLKSDCASNILLYGNPGSGKTEFAKTLAAQSGLKLFIFKNEMENNNDNEKENTLYRLNCLLSIQKSDSIIVVKELMDPAMQRRFHIMTEFKALNENGIKTLLTKYFASFIFSQEDLTALQNYNSVTHGDFNSLYGRIRFMSKENISSEYIITELLNMQKEKNCSRKIGFGE